MLLLFQRIGFIRIWPGVGIPFHLDDRIIHTLLATTTANTVALFAIIFKLWFPGEK